MYSNIWAQYWYIVLIINILLKWRFTNIIISQLLKKLEKGEEAATEKPKEPGEETESGEGPWAASPGCAVGKAKPRESLPEERREE